MYPHHQQDRYGWALHTVKLLREQKMSEVDFDGLIEELEEMSGSDKLQLINRLAQLIFHLLKWQFQPDFRGRIWNATIGEKRLRLGYHLEDNPSLKSTIEESIKKAYKISFYLIEKETQLDLKVLPPECPYTFKQLMDDEFYPE